MTDPKKGCEVCPLQGSRIVHKSGPKKTPLLIVGEAPGRWEERKGIPFVGDSGTLLNNALKHSKVLRKHVAVTNTVRCRPTDARGYNREPKAKELSACSIYLEDVLKEVRPRVIVTLGNTPFNQLVDKFKIGITKIRGGVFWFRGGEAYVVPTYHPSYLIRQGTPNYLLDEFYSDIQVATDIVRNKARPHLPEITLCNDREFAKQHLKLIAYEGITSVDIEGYAPKDIITIGFSYDGGNKAFVIPVNHPESNLTDLRTNQLDPVVYRMIRQILTSSRIEKFGQYFNSFDRYVLENYFKCKISNVRFDTLYGSYILDERSRIHALDLVASRYAKMGAFDYSFKQWGLSQGYNVADGEHYQHIRSCPLEELTVYQGLDVVAQHRCRNAQVIQLNEQGLNLVRTTAAAALATAEMERTGIRFDLEYSKKLEVRYLKDIDKLENFLKFEVGDPDFNPNSSDQVAHYLFEKLQLHTQIPDNDYIWKKLKTGTGKWSTAEPVLQRLLKLTDSVFIKKLLELRDLSKDYGTFIKGLQAIVTDGGRIHCGVVLHGTETGRASCRLHNVKKKEGTINNKKSYILLDQFIAEQGYTLVKADYRQLELRVAAEISQDVNFINLFRQGKDPHRETAQFLFKLKDKQKETEKQRTLAKNFNFGALYGLDEDGMFFYLQSKIPDLKVDRDEVRHFHRAFYENLPDFRKWQLDTVEFSKQHGYVVGLFGRTRKIRYEQANSDYMLKHLENTAINSPIQGSAHDLVLVAMIQAYGIKDRSFRILMDQHDMLLFEVPEETVYDDIKRIKTAMEDLDTEYWYGRKLTVPTPIDIEYGKRWGSLKPYEQHI